MRLKINIISWGVFLILISHMSEEKKPTKKINTGINQIRMNKVAAKRLLRSQLPVFIRNET